MKLIYVSCLISKSMFSNYFSSGIKVAEQQVQKYHRLFVEGLHSNGYNISIVSAPPMTRKISSQIFKRGYKESINCVQYTYLPVLNIPVLKNMVTFMSAFFAQIKICIRDKETVVICDVLNLSISFAAVIVNRLFRRNVIGIVSDLPEMLLCNPSLLFVKMSHAVIQLCTRYILLTEQMNGYLNKKNKPYIIVEGFADIHMIDSDNNLEEKYERKVILYAGALQQKYGIDLLVSGFIKANIPDSELHLYGDGDYVKQIITAGEEHSNIKYFGVVPNEQVVEAEIRATLLVNPRPTNAEYTKYSFPSKNMEYMSTGTPVLTTDLPGMPVEYHAYVYLFAKETIEGVSEALKSLLAKPKEELHQKGAKAKRFVLENKNNIKQASMISSLFY